MKPRLYLRQHRNGYLLYGKDEEGRKVSMFGTKGEMSSIKNLVYNGVPIFEASKKILSNPSQNVLKQKGRKRRSTKKPIRKSTQVRGLNPGKAYHTKEESDHRSTAKLFLSHGMEDNARTSLIKAKVHEQSKKASRSNPNKPAPNFPDIGDAVLITGKGANKGERGTVIGYVKFARGWRVKLECMHNGQHYYCFASPHEFQVVRKVGGRTTLPVGRGNPLNTYTLLTEGYKGSGWEPRFTFHAPNRAVAISKAKGWMRYHGYPQSDVRIRPATMAEITKYGLHDEWVNNPSPPKK